MADRGKLHVMMFPWLAHGHITPFLELAKSLLIYGLRISFVSTPLNIARIRKQMVLGIELVELPLPSVDGLPVGIESTATEPCLAWLDKQPARSVVFASFGSECHLTAQQLDDLLLGLEESEIPFLCVLIGHAAAELHQGFEDRTQGRGLVVTKWAPQLHILNHPSTGAFLSHCGWNSVTEGLRFGVPFVALPIQYEQGLTARLIAEDLKMGVEVRRNGEDGSFTKEDIATAIRGVMVGEESSPIKSNVEEISRVLTSNDCQVHRTNIHNFVSALKDKASSKQTV
ncbi:hypothetical protein SUGI_1128910 [Cryptomeria japonica]|nr:hypothetical protein SUGI_1128910 [Cryptomeria japonica]